jgi:penicillin amidase
LIYTQQPIYILDAVYALRMQKSKADLGGLISAPGLNVMYGDAKGMLPGGQVVNCTNTRKVLTSFHLGWFLREDDITEYLISPILRQ